jgi:Flp pilus assembly CpaE family ATPase
MQQGLIEADPKSEAANEIAQLSRELLTTQERAVA